MLAAECAWAILRAEHARIRELLLLVEDALKTGVAVRGGPQAAPLIELIDRLQAFDEATHRPKGVVLVQILRGRSAESDELLQRLETQRARCDELLSRAKTMLEEPIGDTSAVDDVESLLEEHRRLMLDHLEQEDTLLHSQTAQLLTGEEWAAVASSISETVAPRKS